MNECPLTVKEAVDALNARDLAGTGKEISICVDLLGLAKEIRTRPREVLLCEIGVKVLIKIF